MRIAILSTYPPRHCGLATFTTDLRRAMLEADSSAEVLVVPVLDDDASPSTGGEVLFTLRQHARGDYAAAARRLDESAVDVVLVEHEFGIFGGESGSHLVDLLDHLAVPHVVTLHTLLLDPSPSQREVLQRVVARASQVTVFTALARDQLVRSGLVEWNRVAVLTHGAPEPLRPSPAGRRDTPGPGPGLPELAPHSGRRVLSTFGLLSPSKGLDVAVRGLRTVVDAHPDVLYVIAGRTHPEVVRREGERHREDLRHLVSELRLEDHVLFVDRYLADDEIRSLLDRTEVFITPYRHEEQVVSGVLTFALVAGCPVVSTPYFYATELLSDGAGRLVGFDDHEAMGQAVADLLADRNALAEAERTAYRTGSQLTWPEVGRETLKVLAAATSPAREPVPAPPLTHLERLVDEGGIVQHAVGTEPDRSTGYCVDDVARLAIVADGLVRRGHDDADTLSRTVARSLGFLADARDATPGSLHNFADADGRWLDEPHTGDHVGRAVWALGSVGSGRGETAARSRELLGELVASGLEPLHPRTAAYAVLGLSALPRHHLGDSARRLLRRLSDDLADLLRTTATEDWTWFEDTLTYDNARLPQALVCAGSAQRDAEQLRLGLAALEWYAGQCAVDSGVVVTVGNRWRRRGSAPADLPTLARSKAWDEGDEQPLEAAALVEACVAAYRATGSPVHARQARRAFAWFHGRNRWGQVLVDAVDGGCHDGVGPHGLNPNMGAESTLAHLQAWLALDSVDLLPTGSG
ncbi:glycosyl transferase family 1 [Knoellia flava TL1]|uniref:Glycosyl transferase n=2 Tax=Knoellia flava TaxID=913969 RepID=A0A8H9FV14_9MICO|nr:glycosyltransferase [Knoellia flava]KGN35193.1 glycosyl transferase family 1 [Knoellia flava TL1]GGB89917.1 glycosyl transferase [Knoellia flava]